MFDAAGNLKLIDLGACRGRNIVCEKKFLKESYSAPGAVHRSGTDRTLE